MTIFLEITYFILSILVVNILFNRKPNGSLYCGLVGFSGKDPFNISLIRSLLWHNSLTRGEDATGLFSPSNGIKKGVKKAIDFFDTDEFKSFDKTDNVLLAHVRKATVGNKDNPDSAHPWDLGDIIFEHNGTLTNYESLAKKYNITDYSVDSQVLGLALQENFKDGVPFKVLQEYTGAAAFLMYHKERESLFIYRDSERTLYRGFLGTEMYVSSIPDLLEASGCSDVKLFEPYKVHEYKNGELINSCQIKRRKARKNNVIRILLSDLNDIVSYVRFSQRKITFKDNIYSGIATNVANPELLIGYNIQSKVTISNVPDRASLTIGKWYKIKEIDGNDVRVIDDNNISRKASVYSFNLTNYIPTKMDYVVCLNTYTNSPLRKGEIYEVINHIFGDTSMVIRDHLNNDNYSAEVSDFRLATPSELTRYFGENIVEIDNTDRGLVIKFPENNNSKTDSDELKVITENSEDNDYLVLISKYTFALNLISSHLELTIEDIKQGNTDYTSYCLELIKRFTDEVSDLDSEYIYEINEDSILNLEYEQQ